MVADCPNCRKMLIPNKIVSTRTYIRCGSCNHIYGFETPDLVMTDVRIKELS